LTFGQKEKLYAKGYQVLKTSALRRLRSSALLGLCRVTTKARTRVLCYILEAELKKYVSEVELNVTNGPDLVG